MQTWPSLRTTPRTTSSKNGTEMASRNPNHKDTNLLGGRPQVPENMCFAKKHNKIGLKKMQANNAKAMNACAEAIKALRKPKEVKPKNPKRGTCKLSPLAYIAHPKLGIYARACIAKSVRLCWPKSEAKAQTKALVVAAVLALAPAQASAPKGAQALTKEGSRAEVHLSM